MFNINFFDNYIAVIIKEISNITKMRIVVIRYSNGKSRYLKLL